MTTPARTPKPLWATAFKKRRETEVGSQEELAMRADVSQSLISQIERGVQHPTGVSVERFARLLSALNWTAPAFSEATGITLGPTIEERSSVQPAPFDPRTLFHPPANRRREKRPLSPNLAEMIEDKQEKYPALKETRWQQHLNQTRFSDGKEPEAEGWFEMYQAMRRNNVEPEEWPDDC